MDAVAHGAEHGDAPDRRELQQVRGRLAFGAGSRLQRGRSTSSARVGALAGEGGLDELDGALGSRGRDALLAKTATARRRLRGCRQRLEP